jgi:anti-anti-sigma factor
VDVTCADEMRETMLSVLSLGATAVIADMTRTTFCDSAGVSALVRAQRRASAGGARLRVAAQSTTVLRLFSLIGLTAVIDVDPDVATALRSVGELCRLGDRSQPPGPSGDGSPPAL